MIQVLPCDALEDDAEGGWLKVIMETKVELVAMDSCLKHQQSQHHQMVLQHRNTKVYKIRCCHYNSCFYSELFRHITQQ